MITKLLSLSIPVLALSLFTAGCAASAPDEGDIGAVGDSEDALTTSGKCALSRAKILASTTSARRNAITRGFTWYDDEIEYSQSAWHEGYRTDCSGFVAMSWQLGSSPTTADFISDGSKWSGLGDLEELQPADAIVRRSNGAGHIVMFLGWDDSSHSKACVLEQASSAADMQFRVRTTASLESGGYQPIRATSLPAGSGGGGSASGGSSGGASTAGKLCTNDTQCKDIEWCSKKPMSSGANKGKKRCCTENDESAECN
jgi:hypothetical protein